MVGDGNDFEDILGNGGVLKRIISRGANESLVMDGDRVGVFYVGTLLNGVEFDSNRTFGTNYSKPLEYTVGSGRMITGMDVALKSMSIGERAMFRFRSDYAYGEEGSPERGTSPAIPGGASIEFELEVVDGSAIDTGATDRKNIQKQKLLEIQAERERQAREHSEKKIAKKAALPVVTDPNTAMSISTVVEGASPQEVIHDARWARGLKPNDLKAELKKRDLSTQGAKKDLLARLIGAL